MEMRVRGTVRKLGLEGGVWSLVSDGGETYELVDAPDELKREGLVVEVEGNMPTDEVSIGMLGGSLTVHQFEVLS